MPRKKPKITTQDKKRIKKRRIKTSAKVKIPVKKTDYLNHYISPHLVDLKEEFLKSLAKRSDVSYQEPVEEYFKVEKISLKPEKEVEPVELDLETEKSFSFKPRFSYFKEISITPFKITKKVFIIFDQGVDKLVQPFRQLSLTKKSKAILAFVIMAVILVLPFGGFTYYKNLQYKKNFIVSKVESAAQDLKEAEFSSAQKSFSLAQKELGSINKLVTAIINLIPQTDKALTSAQALLRIGENLSLVGTYLEEATQGLGDDSKTLVEKVEKLKESLDLSLPLIEEIDQKMAKVDINQLPEDQRKIFLIAKAKLPQITQSVKYFVNLTDLLQDILGQNKLKRYLLIFQNNHEIRPSGGFIGSYALLDLVDGEIKNLEIPSGGSYDLQGSLKVNLISPEPLQLVRARWEFQDSNWFPDWPAAAEKIIWFYNQASGPTVDGLIAINADLMEDLLEIVGPVEMSAYGQEINAKNFFAVTQQIVELEYDQEENKPKQFIADLAPEVLTKVFQADPEKLVSIISLFNQALITKDLQLYFTDPQIENKVKELGWGNEIKRTNGDYLLVVNSNIGGQKTDEVIEQDILHQAEIGLDGSIINTVTIVRQHRGYQGELFTGVRNVNYLRLYVPEGSQLISVTGFEPPEDYWFDQLSENYKADKDLERLCGTIVTDPQMKVSINNEFSKTVFGGWTQVDPGESAIVVFKYRLPFRVSFSPYQTNISWWDKLKNRFEWAPETASYSLLVQKQSGSKLRFYSLVDFPEDWQVVWYYPDGLKISVNDLKYGSNLDQDEIYSLMFIK